MASVLDKPKTDLSSLLLASEPIELREPKIPEQPEDQLLEDLLKLDKLFYRRANWTQGSWVKEADTFCMEGGIGHVTGIPRRELSNIGLIVRMSPREGGIASRTQALYRAIVKALPPSQAGDIPRWNDNFSTKFKDIKAVIKKAITTRMEELALEAASTRIARTHF